ncbi:MAG: polysulfide reductase NrfD [Coriobacteriia bacterium]|nr:polysulfide reductase NrfD [Coriobacteriia bacterium]
MMWGTIIAWYLFLAGLSAGAFIASLYVERVYPEKTRFLFVSRIVALIALAIGLVVLIADAEGALHNPVSLFFLLGNLSSSVMSWGVVFLFVLGIVEFLFVVFEFMRKKDNGYTRFFKKSHGVLSVIGLIFAILTAGYTGVLIGVVKTVPLWNNALLPVLFLVSALSSGIAAAIFFTGVTKPSEVDGILKLTKIHASLVATELVLLALMFIIVSSGNPAGAESVAMLLSGSLAPLFWIVLVLLGLSIPLIFELLEITGKVHNVYAAIVMELLVVIGAFCLRYLIIEAAVPLNFLGF